jgi:2-phosphoglycerate kinase
MLLTKSITELCTHLHPDSLIKVEQLHIAGLLQRLLPHLEGEEEEEEEEEEEFMYYRRRRRRRRRSCSRHLSKFSMMRAIFDILADSHPATRQLACC